jgi:hypothetical protein
MTTRGYALLVTLWFTAAFIVGLFWPYVPVKS